VPPSGALDACRVFPDLVVPASALITIENELTEFGISFQAALNRRAVRILSSRGARGPHSILWKQLSGGRDEAAGKSAEFAPPHRKDARARVDAGAHLKFYVI